MYNNTTRSYTMYDDSSKPLNWLIEGLDPADFQTLTDDDIYAWVDREIANVKENAGYELDEKLESLTFPLMGYTTDQIFQDADEYETFKRAEIDSDLSGERESVFKFLKTWIGEPGK